MEDVFARQDHDDECENHPTYGIISYDDKCFPYSLTSSLLLNKVVLIDKVVLGGPKKGYGNWKYFWVQVLCRQHLWVQKFEEKSGKFKIQIYNFAGQ